MVVYAHKIYNKSNASCNCSILSKYVCFIQLCMLWMSWNKIWCCLSLFLFSVCSICISIWPAHTFDPGCRQQYSGLCPLSRVTLPREHTDILHFKSNNLRLVSFIACVTFITKHNIEILTINGCKTLKSKWTFVTQSPFLTSTIYKA